MKMCFGSYGMSAPFITKYTRLLKVLICIFEYVVADYTLTYCSLIMGSRLVSDPVIPIGQSAGNT